MKKLILSLIFGLSFAAATPAQAAWYDWIPGISWFRTSQVQNQPVHQDIEAQRAAAPRASWFSSIVRSPIAAFSAWWNKSKVATQTNNELRQTNDRLHQLAQERAQVVLQNGQTVDRLQELNQERAKQILALNEELAKVKAQNNNPVNNFSEAERAELRKKEADLQARLDILQKQNSTLSYAKEREEQARKALEEKLAHEASARRLAEEHLNKTTEEVKKNEAARLVALDRLEKRLAAIEQEKIQKEAEKKIAEEQANAAHERLANVEADQIIKELADQPLKPRPVFSNPLESSLGFIAMESGKQPEDAFYTKELEMADEIVNPEFIGPKVQQEYMRIKQIPELKDLPSWEHAVNQIKLGALWAYRLVTNQVGQIKKIEESSQSQYLKAINALNWYYYAHALRKGKGFEEGTNVIEDRGFRFHNFKLKYLKLVNPAEVTGEIKDSARHVTQNPFGTARDSSHFKESQRTNRHYGIDARWAENGYATKDFPAAKRHILFGICDQNRQLIFAKPENYGLYLWDGVISGDDGIGGHTWEFIAAQIRKNKLAQMAGMVNKNDDHPDYAKERIPKQFKDDLKKALETANLTAATRQEILNSAEYKGLQTLTRLPGEARNVPSLSALRAKYEAQYDNLELRTGRENIITHNDIINSFKPRLITQ